MNDCLAYDEKKVTLEEYFIKPRPVINPRSWNHNRMMDAAFPENFICINNNKAYMHFEGIIIF